MSLPVGASVGFYQINALIGAGGMGEVYRARDPKLNRDVALKVLPAAFAGDAERLARLKREAQVLASLNHPGIAAVYGFEDAHGVHALVLEMVEGPTLGDVVAQGPLPLDTAIAIAKQIVDALAAAHEQGVVHRDLKPANVKVRPDGTVKVLDFGLAKAVEPAVALSSVSISPTITTPAMTQAGLILGTAAYMSPEQARGKSVDRRTDVWAFGCVLYEMLTGTRAFEDEDVSLTLSRILQREPDLDRLPSATPAHIRQVIALCLRKDARQRVGDMQDVRLILDGSFDATEPIREKAVNRWRPALASAIAATLVTGLAVWALRGSTTPMERPIVRFDIRPPGDSVFPGAFNTPRMAVSPDGKSLAVTIGTRDGKTDQLWVRRLDSLELRQVTDLEVPTGTEPVQQPFWSPDSRFIAFFAAGTLQKVDVASGVVQTLCSVEGNQYGGTWNLDGTILFSSSRTNGVRRVSAAGGTPSQVTTLDASSNETGHFWPRFLPDGRRFLFQVQTGGSPEDRAIVIGSLDSAERHLVTKSMYMADFARDQLLFVRNDALLAQRFDVRTAQLTGEPVVVAQSIQGSSGNGRAGFTVSATGLLVYRAGAGSSGDSQLAWVDRSGSEIATVGTPANYRGLHLSPDATRVAVHREENTGGDVWILDLTRGSDSRVTLDAVRHNMDAVWMPGAGRIVFSKGGGASWSIYEKSASGSGDERLLYQTKGWAVPWDVTNDGKTLLLSEQTDGGADLLTLSLEERTQPSPYLRAPGVQGLAQFSPDGRWVAYASNESGVLQVYVESFPKPGTRIQVSTGGGNQPRWRSDGREIFYRTGVAGAGLTAMMSVNVESVGPVLRFGIPQQLFTILVGSSAHVTPIFQYDVSADGKRFLVVRAPGGASVGSQAPLTVVVNWDAALSAGR